MKSKTIPAIGIVALMISVFVSLAFAAQDKYTVKVPGGLAFSEFRGYESWQFISVSHTGPHMAATFGNPLMIKAYAEGIPANGKPVPDGAKMAKIHWTTKDLETLPGSTVPASSMTRTSW
jgi:Cytochrome P460